MSWLGKRTAWFQLQSVPLVGLCRGTTCRAGDLKWDLSWICLFEAWEGSGTAPTRGNSRFGTLPDAVCHAFCEEFDAAEEFMCEHILSFLYRNRHAVCCGCHEARLYWLALSGTVRSTWLQATSRRKESTYICIYIIYIMRIVILLYNMQSLYSTIYWVNTVSFACKILTAEGGGRSFHNSRAGFWAFQSRAPIGAVTLSLNFVRWFEQLLAFLNIYVVV